MNTILNNDLAKYVLVEVKLGSGKVGSAKIKASTYLHLREQFALGRNNCFRKDDQEEGAVRWAARLVNKYEGWDRGAKSPHSILDIRELSLSTKSYAGRWKDYEIQSSKAYGLILRGHAEKEKKGKEIKTERKSYTPDGTDPITGDNYEYKAGSARFRRGQAQRTV